MIADAGPRRYDTGWVDRGPYRIHTRVYPGTGTPLVLLHGLPDNLHLYDRLLPHLPAARKVITFDFLGWGESDKPGGYMYTSANQVGDLAAIVDQLGLERVVLIAHDASGPPAIDWAIANPHRVSTLVLLNTYYAWTPRLRRPEAIFLYSTPLLRNLARTVARRFEGLDRRLYTWQVGRFISDPQIRRTVVPEFYAQFRASRPAFWRLNDDLLPTVISRRKMISQLKTFTRPVRIIFGADDPYLNTQVARRFARLFPVSDLHLIPGARHYVQVDAPARVASLIASAG